MTISRETAAFQLPLGTEEPAGDQRLGKQGFLHHQLFSATYFFFTGILLELGERITSDSMAIKLQSLHNFIRSTSFTIFSYQFKHSSSSSTHYVSFQTPHPFSRIFHHTNSHLIRQPILRWEQYKSRRRRAQTHTAGFPRIIRSILMARCRVHGMKSRNSPFMSIFFPKKIDHSPCLH